MHGECSLSRDECMARLGQVGNRKTTEVIRTKKSDSRRHFPRLIAKSSFLSPENLPYFVERRRGYGGLVMKAYPPFKKNSIEVCSEELHVEGIVSESDLKKENTK